MAYNEIQSSFIIKNVEGDNACFYRALANQLYYRSCYNTSQMILSNNNRWRTKRIEDMDNKMWGYNGPQQTKTAKVLQQIARKYIYKNRNKIISSLGIKVKDFVSIIHDFSRYRLHFDGWEDIDIYNDMYKSFAGDRLLLEDFKPIENIKRWGSAVEQWALSEHFKVPIIVWELCRRDNNNKICKGIMRNNKPTKNSFFKMSQVFGEKYDRPALNILYRSSCKMKHYLSLYS